MKNQFFGNSFFGKIVADGAVNIVEMFLLTVLNYHSRAGYIDNGIRYNKNLCCYTQAYMYHNTPIIICLSNPFGGKPYIMAYALNKFSKFNCLDDMALIDPLFSVGANNGIIAHNQDERKNRALEIVNNGALMEKYLKTAKDIESAFEQLEHCFRGRA